MDEERIAVEANLKILAKSSMFIFVGVILSKLLAYFYRIIIARNFGPEIYGTFSLALAVTGLFVFISAFGLDAGILRFVSFFRGKKDSDKMRFVFKKAISVQVASSIIFGILLLILSDYVAINFFHSPQLSVFLKFFSIIVPLNVLFTSYLGTLKAFEKIGWYSFTYNILQNVVKLAFLILFIWLGFEINSVIFSYILGFIIPLVFAYFLSRKILKGIYGKVLLGEKERKNLFKEVVAYSWPLMFFALNFSILYWANSFILGYFRTVEEVAFYDVAVSIGMLLSLTPSIFMHLFFPLITKKYSENEKNTFLIGQLSQQVGKWIFIINFPVLMLIFIFPGVFINVLFGSQYLVAETALRMLVFAFFFDSIFTISNNLISMLGKSKLIFFDISVAALLNVVLGLLLVPAYGINGAAFSTMVAFILMNILFIIQAKVCLNVIPVRRDMLKILLVSLIPAIFLLLARKYLAINSGFVLVMLGFAYFFVYICLIFFTRSFDRNDIEIVKSFRRKIYGLGKSLSFSGKQPLNNTSNTSKHEKTGMA